MREILFRGKRVDNGEWAESPYPYGTMSGGVVQHDFISQTVGQYTGALDCYEKKIYEGDILRYITDYDGVDGVTRTIDTRAVVVWDPDVLGFACKEIGDDSGDLYSWLEMRENPDIEIIGNIYDNPELIEEDTRAARRAERGER